MFGRTSVDEALWHIQNTDPPPDPAGAAAQRSPVPGAPRRAVRAARTRSAVPGRHNGVTPSGAAHTAPAPLAETALGTRAGFKAVVLMSDLRNALFARRPRALRKRAVSGASLHGSPRSGRRTPPCRPDVPGLCPDRPKRTGTAQPPPRSAETRPRGPPPRRATRRPGPSPDTAPTHPRSRAGRCRPAAAESGTAACCPPQPAGPRPRPQPGQRRSGACAATEAGGGPGAG